MCVELLKIGSFTLYGYGFMIAIGCICALIVARYRAKQKKLDSDFVLDLFCYCAIFGFLGAKLLYCLVSFDEFIKNPIQFLGSSGFVVYGGIILGFVGGLIACKRKKKKFLDYFDLVMPSVSIAQGFGRIGCFLAGCCYGKETNSWIGVTFPQNSIAPSDVALIPTQLLSSIGNFIIAGILILYARKNTKSGNVGLLYMLLYCIGRFFIEFLRSDYRGEIWIFTTSQFISICIFILLLFLFIFKMKKERKVLNP